MTKATFVTGGTGFVGGALVARLVTDGREVRALARGPAAAATLDAVGAVPVAGDVLDREALVVGMRGCETVFHVAGANAMCTRDPAAMDRTNIDGSAAVVRAAAEAGVARVVHTSSATTIGEPAGAVGREDTSHRGWFLSTYERSKSLGERLVLEESRRLGIQAVCVNPSSVQGPGRATGSAQLLIRFVDARIPVIVRTFISIVDIRDCVEGHLLAEARGEPGCRYLLNGATVSTGTAAALVRAAAGRPRTTLRLPRATVRMAGALADAVSRVQGRPLPFCGEMARTLLHGHRYDGSRAERELGLRYTPIEVTLRRTLEWYAASGLARPLEGPAT